MTEQEAIAGLQVLVAIARADGKLDDREREALGRAIDEFKPAGAPSVESLLAQPVEFDAAVAAITSRDGQRAVFAAAVAMAFVDSVNSPEERRLVERLRTAFELSNAPGNAYKKVLGRGGGLFTPRITEPVADAELRRHEVARVIRSHAFWCGVMGTIPSPVVDAVFVLSQQISMCERIAILWGSKLSAKEFFATASGALALDAVALGAASFLKLVPVWGSVFGAAVSYANTFVVGMAFDEYLQRGGKMTRDEVREAMARARAEAKSAFSADKVRIGSAHASSGPTLESLTQDFQDGKLSIEEFERGVEALEHAELHAQARANP